MPKIWKRAGRLPRTPTTLPLPTWLPPKKTTHTARWLLASLPGLAEGHLPLIKPPDSLTILSVYCVNSKSICTVSTTITHPKAPPALVVVPVRFNIPTPAKANNPSHPPHLSMALWITSHHGFNWDNKKTPTNFYDSSLTPCKRPVPKRVPKLPCSMRPRTTKVRRRVEPGQPGEVPSANKTRNIPFHSFGEP